MLVVSDVARFSVFVSGGSHWHRALFLETDLILTVWVARDLILTSGSRSRFFVQHYPRTCRGQVSLQLLASGCCSFSCKLPIQDRLRKQKAITVWCVMFPATGPRQTTYALLVGFAVLNYN